MEVIISAVLSYNFIWRALVVGLLISVCCALLGVTLVLKRYSMIGDGLSHISFGAIAVASVLGFSPLKVALPVAAVASVLLMKMSSKKLKGDSAIAVISCSALALGILFISYSGSGTDMNNYLIGSLYSVSGNDMVLSVILGIAVVLIFVFFYNRIFSVTFDEEFSKATSGLSRLCSFLIAILTSVTVVIGMRLMGALLISALIVFPALSSMRVFRSFLSVTISSVLISLICFIFGFAMTIVLDRIPTGACITLVNLAVFLGFTAIGRLKQRA